MAVADRIRRQYAERASTIAGTLATLSVGVAEGDTQRMPFDRLWENADRALYEAKSAGRNRTQLFNPGIAQAAN